MNYIKKYAVPLLIIIVSLVLLYFFRSLPSAKMWNGYTMMYADLNADFENIVQALEKYDCKDFICFENQQVPLAFSKQTPEVALAMSGIENSDYIEKRKNFFFDKNREVRIIYIPEKYKRNAVQVCDYLSKEGITAGTGGKATYPIVAVIICIIFTVLLTFFSEKRVLFAFSSIFPVLLCISLPFYQVLVGSCLFTSAIFLCEKLWKREKALSVILKNIYINIFFVTSLLIMIFSGIKCFLLFLCTVLSVVSSIYLYYCVEKHFEKRFYFVPVKIRSAKFIPTFTEKSSLQLLACSAAIAIILLVAFLTSSFSFGNSANSSNFQLPCQNGNGSLPNIQEFINWEWNAMTFPYLTLNEKKPTSKTVSFSQFTTENGYIKEEIKSISFNQNFIDESIKNIDNLNFPAIEKMMKLQKKDFRGGYASSSSQNLTILTIILILIAVQIPLICRLLYKIRKRRCL